MQATERSRQYADRYKGRNKRRRPGIFQETRLMNQAGSIVNFYCSDVEFICYWVPYFDIDSDYGRYIEKVNPRDTYLSAAVQCGNGIRILRQDLWE